MAKSELVELFEKRDAKLQKESKKILKKIDKSVKGVDKFLRENDPVYLMGNMTWENAQLVEEEGQTFVVIIGTLTFDPGTLLHIENGIFEVTEDNHTTFGKVLRAGIPIKVVEKNSEKAILSFLNEMKEKSGDVEEDLMSDFDLDGLTDDQKRALTFSGEKPH